MKLPRIMNLTSPPCQALCDLVGCFSTKNGPLWAGNAGKVPDAAAIPANVQACQIRAWTKYFRCSIPISWQYFYKGTESTVRIYSLGRSRKSNGLKYAEKSDQEIAEGCNQLIKKSTITWNYLYLTLKITLRRKKARKSAIGCSTSSKHIHFCCGPESIHHSGILQNQGITTFGYRSTINPLVRLSNVSENRC